MEDLPEYVKLGNNYYWLVITKATTCWQISYCLMSVDEDSVSFKLPAHFFAEGELNQCIAEIKRQISNANSQPKATK